MRPLRGHLTHRQMAMPFHGYHSGLALNHFTLKLIFNIFNSAVLLIHTLNTWSPHQRHRNRDVIVIAVEDVLNTVFKKKLFKSEL